MKKTFAFLSAIFLSFVTLSSVFAQERLSPPNVNQGRLKTDLEMAPLPKTDPFASAVCDEVRRNWFEENEAEIRSWRKRDSNCELAVQLGNNQTTAFVGSRAHPAFVPFLMAERLTANREMTCTTLRRAFVHRLRPSVTGYRCSGEGDEQQKRMINYVRLSTIRDENQEIRGRFIDRLPEGAYREQVKIVEFIMSAEGGPGMCAGIIETEDRLVNFTQHPNVPYGDPEREGDLAQLLEYNRAFEKSKRLCERLLLAHIRDQAIEIDGRISRAEFPFVEISDTDD